MSKDLRFLSRFFHPVGKRRPDAHAEPEGRLVWDSYHKGAYVRAIHGELK